ncbi:MAG TPA: response regulator [Polyangiaceae bacterium]|jgi:two-component system response regulator HydG
MQSAPETPRVLVVDDKQEMADMLADDLSDRGFHGISALSGDEALRVLRTERVDVLVTDLRMPDVDGLDLLRASLALDPSRPVIMMTGYGTLDSAMEATGRGAFHYLFKPFRLDVLVRVVEQALRSR